MDCLKKCYQTDYSPNTREKFRRLVLHQFVQGCIADYTVFDPGLPTNSPNVHYAFIETALEAVQACGTKNWYTVVEIFLRDQGSLAERYENPHERKSSPVRLSGDYELQLSSDEHNEFHKSIVEVLVPRFALGAYLLYLRDTVKKDLYINENHLSKIGIPITYHDKLPDVAIYDAERNWLFLVEAVVSHGPVSSTRTIDLNKCFSSVKQESSM